MERMKTRGKGTLHIVSLPIGNMADITLRAIAVLRSVDFIVAEDTRTTRRILTRYRIKTPFFSSLYQGAEQRRTEAILKLLVEGKDVALVSDAGTPLISDPGYPLVRAAVERGIRVTPIPGPTGAIAALVASGLPTDRFTFFGPVPRRPGEMERLFERLREWAGTSIVYPSPHRLSSTLDALAKILPDRRLVLARELTKIHEEFLRGTAADIRRDLDENRLEKGESVLLIEGKAKEKGEVTAAQRVAAILAAEGIPKRTILKVLVSGLGIARNEAYRLIHVLIDRG